MSLPEFVDRCFGEFNTSKTNANCPELFYFSIFPSQTSKAEEEMASKSMDILENALLALLSGIEIVTKHLKKGVELFELLYNLLVFTSMIMSIVSVWFSARSGHRFNGLIISFSIGALLFEGSFLMQLLLKNGYKFPFWSTIRVLLLTILNISFFQQDQHDENNKACPIDSAGFYSILFISWFTKQISIGNKKSLKMEDLFNLPINAKSEFLRKQWREAWEIEKKNKPKNPSIIWAIHRCHGWHIFFISLLQLASDVARNLTNPLLLKCV
ncbi:unnamed protein product, partial [Mesorhabditis belari]|uniref:Uncharacterized protein n=1 Tax=Mesorhabditis belari TaxID=2138241 RepID=A0AAF3FK77_9BILA